MRVGTSGRFVVIKTWKEERASSLGKLSAARAAAAGAGRGGSDQEGDSQARPSRGLRGGDWLGATRAILQGPDQGRGGQQEGPRSLYLAPFLT